MIRKFMTFTLFILALTASLTLAQGEALTATSISPLNVRSGPAKTNPRVAALPIGAQFVIEGRNEAADWLLIHTADGGVRGWVAIGFVRFDHAVRVTDLPVMTEQVAPGASAPVGDGTPAPAPNATPTLVPERTDYPTLALGQAVIRNARAIYRRGQQFGNNGASFMKIGESNTGGTVYMCNFEWKQYDLGNYQYLQGIVDMFNQTQSFCRNNITAGNGFSTSTILDPMWSPTDICQSNVSPLECEIGRSRPAYAFIYMGIADMASLTDSQFRANLTRVIQILSSNGVIPILSTFPMSDKFNDGKPQAFNAVIRQVASRQSVPLIDLRAATYRYENRGTGPDGYHLSVATPDFSSFAGDELVYGRTLRELLTLQVLDQLHVQVNQ